MEPNTAGTKQVKYLRNRKTGVLFPYSEKLAKRKDMEPMIDKDTPLFDEVVDGRSVGAAGRTGEVTPYLKNVKTGVVFPYNEQLAKNSSMIPWRVSPEQAAQAAALKPAKEENSTTIAGAPDAGGQDAGDPPSNTADAAGQEGSDTGADTDEDGKPAGDDAGDDSADAEDTSQEGDQSQQSEGGEGIPPVAGEGNDLMCGEVALASATKDQCIEFADKAFGKTLKKADSVGDLRAQVAELILNAE